MALTPSSASSSFVKPSSEKRSTGLKGLAQMRKRKRREVNASTLSITSLESVVSTSPPPDTKRSKRSLSRVTSFALSTPVGKILQRSLSSARLPHSSPSQSPSSSSADVTTSTTPTRFPFCRSISTAVVASPTSSPRATLKRGAPGRNSATHLTPYKPPQPTPNKQRPTRYWSERFSQSLSKLSKQEIKLQEAIYEVSCGEEDLVEDMQLVQKTYADSLLRLNILTAEEVESIFGKLKLLPSLHVELYRSLRDLRSPQTGVSAPAGKTILNWTNKVRDPYVQYCGSLIRAKAILDARRESDKDFSDFLQRCLESPFSRKLDLWSYLDVPRSRLVKYPLLVKQILKYSECPVDCAHLAHSIDILEKILQDVDASMARSRCSFTLSRLDWLHEPQEPCEAVKNATEEMLEGVLRNNRGTKLECHLMDTVLILGRPTTRGSSGIIKRLQVYRQPIPVDSMVVEDLDGSMVVGHGSGSSTGSSGRQGGSFKSAFSSGQTAKNSFRVSFRACPLTMSSSSAQPQQTAHTLTASDEHCKRKWINTLQQTMDKTRRRQCHDAIQEENGEEASLAATTALFIRKSSSRTALFQKKKRSPRIKASLSHTALENLNSGVKVKRLRKNYSQAHSFSEKKPPLMPRSRQKQQEKKSEQKRAALKEQNPPRARTKSWSHLNIAETGRYLTRSKAKSLTDLVQV